MARRTKRAVLVLDDAMRERLEQLERSLTGQAREIERGRPHTGWWRSCGRFGPWRRMFVNRALSRDLPAWGAPPRLRCTVACPSSRGFRRAWLAQHPNRFEYVHTPTHDSWLSLAECLFSKMSRAFLRHMRVDSWDELRQRILLGVEEMNQGSVVTS